MQSLLRCVTASAIAIMQIIGDLIQLPICHVLLEIQVVWLEVVLDGVDSAIAA